jgi:hypothetical protein
MKLEVFETILSNLNTISEKQTAAYDIGIDLINYNDIYNNVISLLFKSHYGKEGAEWIEWFIYEKSGKEDICAYDSDGNEICKTVEELWNIVENIRLSPDFEEYEIPPILTIEERLKILGDMLNKNGKL